MHSLKVILGVNSPKHCTFIYQPQFNMQESTSFQAIYIYIYITGVGSGGGGGGGARGACAPPHFFDWGGNGMFVPPHF